MYSEESAIWIIFILNVQAVYLNIQFQKALFPIENIIAYMEETEGLPVISCIH